jgi:hypothetical protein
VPSCAAIESETAIETGLKDWATNNGIFKILYRNYDGKKPLTTVKSHETISLAQM